MHGGMGACVGNDSDVCVSQCYDMIGEVADDDEMMKGCSSLEGLRRAASIDFDRLGRPIGCGRSRAVGLHAAPTLPIGQTGPQQHDVRRAGARRLRVEAILNVLRRIEVCTCV